MISFEEFFQAVTGFEPFAWQKRLAYEVIESELSAPAWPKVCALPTASGKTGTILIALYALARRSDAHRRIAYVVDRRLVVDSGYDGIVRFQKTLLDGDSPILNEWADAVRSNCRLAEGDNPLEVMILRGGLGEPLARLRSPVTPTVMVSTVDQLGSRLLFRGYGASPRSWPIAAGLLAYDTLWLLDEAHLSTAFAETLAQVQAIADAGPIAKPIRVVELSATPRPSTTPVFTLGLPDERIRPRLQATKPTTIIDVTSEKELVKAAVDAVKREHRLGRKRIGVIVNRIRTARDIFTEIRKISKTDVVLLIGPIRPHDRDSLYGGPPVTTLFANSALPETPTIAVCTQTVEVGADLDFDALISQSAPIDVLMQRFGRLDRLGMVATRGDGSARGTIIHHATEKSDSIYGTALGATIRFLRQLNSLDFGVEAFAEHRRYVTNEMCTEAKHAEPLVGPHVERLAQTLDAPYDSPDIAAFLHGKASDPDVSVCWRSALLDGHEDTWKTQVEAALPCQGEVLTIPLYAARAWLARTVVEHADISALPAKEDGADDRPTKDDRANNRLPRNAFLLRAGERVGDVYDYRGLRAGDTVVVPATYGGCDQFGWAPSAKHTVEDLAELAYFDLQARRARLAVVLSNSSEDEADDAYRDALKSIEDEKRRTIAQILSEHINDLSETPANGTTWLTWRERLSNDDRVPDGSSLLRKDITLSSHSAHVRDRAREFALKIGIAEYAETLASAGWLHDLGKADIVMQSVLCRGVLAEEPLAKGRRGRKTAEQRLLRLPKGYRHETISVSMLDGFLQNADIDLLRHLIGTHHGYGRPWFPPSTESEIRDVEVSLDGVRFAGTSAPNLHRIESGWIEQFARLIKRYGPWGLAYLEAILRLADHRCSEEEEL